MLYKMVQFEQQSNRTPSAESLIQNAFFIDRDPDLFAAILRYHDTEEYQKPAGSITPASLLLEAHYYNLQSLEKEIVLAKSATDQYEFCCLMSSGHRSYSFPLSKETGKASNPGLEALHQYAEISSYLARIEEELARRNTIQPPDGYHWTLHAVTGLGTEKSYQRDNVVNNSFINVILKKEAK